MKMHSLGVAGNDKHQLTSRKFIERYAADVAHRAIVNIKRVMIRSEEERRAYSSIVTYVSNYNFNVRRGPIDIYLAFRKCTRICKLQKRLPFFCLFFYFHTDALHHPPPSLYPRPHSDLSPYVTPPVPPLQQHPGDTLIERYYKAKQSTSVLSSQRRTFSSIFTERHFGFDPAENSRSASSAACRRLAEKYTFLRNTSPIDKRTSPLLIFAIFAFSSFNYVHISRTTFFPPTRKSFFNCSPPAELISQ
jgi:hypothetical protein